jgi:hypothetical protein
MALLSYIGGLATGLAAMLFNTWFVHQLEKDGWQSVWRSLGSVAMVALIVHLALHACGGLYSLATYAFVGYPPPIWPYLVHLPGLPFLLFHALFVYVLFVLRRDLMLVCAALILWADNVFSVYVIWRFLPGQDISLARWIAAEIDHAMRWSFLLVGTLMAVFAVAAAVMLLHSRVVRAREELEAMSS